MGNGDNERCRLAGMDTKLCFAEYGANKVRPYRLYIPSSYQYAPPEQGQDVSQFPLVVMMHGGGSVEFPCDENWYFANKETPERVQAIAEERGYIIACPALPFTLVPASVEDRRKRMVKEIEEETVPFIKSLIKDITYNLHIDEGRIYLVGASRGGFALYALVSDDPSAYKAVVPVCTHAIPEWVENAAKVPTFIMAAREDAIFAIEKTRELKQELADLGCEVKMEEFDGGHDGFRNMVAYNMIFDWFDAHK